MAHVIMASCLCTVWAAMFIGLCFVSKMEDEDDAMIGIVGVLFGIATVIVTGMVAWVLHLNATGQL